MDTDKMWAQSPAKTVSVPYSKGLDTTIQVDGNILIAGKSARFNALNHLLVQMMGVLSPENLRISIATSDAQELACYARSPYVDFLAIAKKDIETLRILKRVSGIVQMRHTIKCRVNPVTMLILDEPARLFTKVNKAALTELYGILSLGPEVNVYTVILTSKCTMPKAIIGATSVRICTCLDEKSAIELTGSNIPATLSDSDHQVFVYQPSSYSARGTIPVVGQEGVESVNSSFALAAKEKGLKEYEVTIFTDEEG